MSKQLVIEWAEDGTIKFIFNLPGGEELSLFEALGVLDVVKNELVSNIKAKGEVNREE